MFQRKVYRLETCVRPDVDAVSQMHALDDKGLCSLLKTADYYSWRFKGCHMISQIHRNSEMGVGIQNTTRVVFPSRTRLHSETPREGSIHISEVRRFNRCLLCLRETRALPLFFERQTGAA